MTLNYFSDIFYSYVLPFTFYLLPLFLCSLIFVLNKNCREKIKQLFFFYNENNNAEELFVYSYISLNICIFLFLMISILNDKNIYLYNFISIYISPIYKYFHNSIIAFEFIIYVFNSISIKNEN